MFRTKQVKMNLIQIFGFLCVVLLLLQNVESENITSSILECGEFYSPSPTTEDPQIEVSSIMVNSTLSDNTSSASQGLVEDIDEIIFQEKYKIFIDILHKNGIYGWNNETNSPNISSSIFNFRVQLPSYATAMANVDYQLQWNWLVKSRDFIKKSIDLETSVGGRNQIWSNILKSPELNPIVTRFSGSIDQIQADYLSGKTSTYETYELYERDLNDLHQNLFSIIMDETKPENTKLMAVWYKEASFQFDQIYMRFLRGQVYRDQVESIVQQPPKKSVKKFQTGQKLYSRYLLQSTLLEMSVLLSNNLPDSFLPRIQQLATEAYFINDYYDPDHAKLRVDNELREIAYAKTIKEVEKNAKKLKSVGSQIREKVIKELGFSQAVATFGSYITISDVQDLVIGAVSSRQLDHATVLMGFGNALSENIIQTGVKSGGELDKILMGLPDQNVNKKHDFVQIEFETKFDLTDQGHCQSYSHLYAIHEMINGEVGVNDFMTRIRESANSYDSSRNGFNKDPIHKETSDSFRSLLDAMYGDRDGPLSTNFKTILEQNRPQTAGPPNKKLTLPDLMYELKLDQTSNRKGVIIGTNNHAMALSYDKTNSQYTFFDPNSGIYSFEEPAAYRVLSTYFNAMKEVYKISENSNTQLEFKGDFYDENTARQIHDLEFGPRKTKISDTIGKVKLPEVVQEASSDVLKAKNVGKTLLAELARELGSTSGHLIPDFFRATVIHDEIVRIPVISAENSQIREIEIKSEKMGKALEFLQKIGSKLSAAFKWDEATAGIKQGSAEPEILASGMEGLNLLAIVQASIKPKPSPNSPLPPPYFSKGLETAIEVFSYMNLAQGGVQTTVELLHTALSVIAREGSVISKSLSRLSAASHVLGVTGAGLNIASIGLDIAQVIEAKKKGDEGAIMSAATSLTFDTVFFGLWVAGMVAAETAATVIGYIAAPVAGLAIGIGGLVKAYAQSIGESKEVLAHLKEVMVGYQYHGFYVSSATENSSEMILPKPVPISTIDFVSDSITFGPSWICKNQRITLSPPSCKQPPQWLDLREGFGVPANVSLPFNKSISTLILPFTGVLRIDYEAGNTGIFWADRYDTPLTELEQLYDRTGHQFSFYSAGAGMYALRKMWNEYENIDTTVLLDNSYRHLVMVRADTMPTHQPRMLYGTNYASTAPWNLKYKLVGRGGQYGLTLSRKNQGGIYVDLMEAEDNNSDSTWFLHLGEDSRDNVDVVDDKSVNIGGVLVWIQSPERTKIFLNQRNGQVLRIGKIGNPVYIDSLNGDWVRNQIQNGSFETTLHQIVESGNLSTVNLLDLPCRFTNEQLINTTGVYISSIRKIQVYRDSDKTLFSTMGKLHEYPQKHIDLQFEFVNCSGWRNINENEFTNAKRKFLNLSEVYNLDEINFVDLELDIGKVYSGKYSTESNIISAWNQFGTFDVISLENLEKLETRVAGVNIDWITSKIQQRQLQSSTKLIELLSTSLSTIKTSSIIQLIGFKTEDNSSDYANLWYDTGRDAIIAGGPDLQNKAGVELVGYSSGMYWLFNRPDGEVLAQLPMSHINTTVEDVNEPPLVKNAWRRLGKIVAVDFDSRGSVLVTNEQYYRFLIKNSLSPPILYSIVESSRNKNHTDIALQHGCVLPEALYYMSADPENPNEIAAIIHVPRNLHYYLSGFDFTADNITLIGFGNENRRCYVYSTNLEILCALLHEPSPNHYYHYTEADRRLGTYCFNNVSFALRIDNWVSIQNLEMELFPEHDPELRYEVMPKGFIGVQNILFQFTETMRHSYVYLDWKRRYHVPATILIESLDPTSGIQLPGRVTAESMKCPNPDDDFQSGGFLELPGNSGRDRTYLHIQTKDYFASLVQMFFWVDEPGNSTDVVLTDGRNTLVFVGIKSTGLNPDWTFETIGHKDTTEYKASIYQMISACIMTKQQYKNYNAWINPPPIKPRELLKSL